MVVRVILAFLAMAQGLTAKPDVVIASVIENRLRLKCIAELAGR